MPRHVVEVNIARSVALWIFSLGRRLVQEGTGTNWDPRYLDSGFAEVDEQPGFMDELPMGSPSYAWADACVMLIRTIVAICADQLGDVIPDGRAMLTAITEDRDDDTAI